MGVNKECRYKSRTEECWWARERDVGRCCLVSVGSSLQVQVLVEESMKTSPHIGLIALPSFITTSCHNIRIATSYYDESEQGQEGSRWVQVRH